MTGDPAHDGRGGSDGAVTGRGTREVLDGAEKAPETHVERLSPASGSGEWQPDWVGPYRLVRELGRGGMGAVYLAERSDEEFVQQVALKMVAGAASRELRRRFLHERQILAGLDHPAIARLLDAGTTDAGVPYLVMEYVDGIPIDDYCDGHGLDLKQRLDLFARVCGAVDYAHRNLVVHRDLKPGNILVTPEGEPKLLDFGIAKLLAEEGGENPEITRLNRVPLTPAYASPEQIRGDAITTASDVYSLGVVLYQLLTGRKPYRLSGRPAAEIERVVCGETPPRPSTIVTQPAEGGAERGPALERRKLARELAEDLDNVVLKALAKLPEERYGSAADLAEDLDRYQRGMPVSARAATWSYRARRFVGRHRLGVAAAAGVVALLVMLGARERALRSEAEMARDQARTEAAKAEAVNDFLNEMLVLANPGETSGEELTVKQALERAAGTVGDRLEAQPAVEAAVRTTLGRTYVFLGEFEQGLDQLRAARELIRETLGEDSDEFVEAGAQLAYFLRRTGHLEEAESLAQSTLELVGERGAQPHSRGRLLQVQGTLARHQGRHAAAEALLREAFELDLAHLPESSRRVDLMQELAHALSAENRLDEAMELHREALAILKRRPTESLAKSSTILNNIAVLLRRQGRLDDAEQHYLEAYRIRTEIYGEDHFEVAVVLANIGNLRWTQYRLAEAEEVLRESARIHREVFPDDHPGKAFSLDRLANVLAAMGEFDEAEALVLEARAMIVRLFGEVSGHAGTVANTVGRIYAERGDLDTSRTWYRRSIETYAEALGERHFFWAYSAYSLAEVEARAGRFDEAEALLRKALEVILENFEEGGVDDLRVRARLAELEVMQGRWQEGEALLRPILEQWSALDSAVSGESWRQHLAESALGEALARQGRLDEARPLLDSAYEALNQRFGEAHRLTRLTGLRRADLEVLEGGGEPPQEPASPGRIGP